MATNIVKSPDFNNKVGTKSTPVIAKSKKKSILCKDLFADQVVNTEKVEIKPNLEPKSENTTMPKNDIPVPSGGSFSVNTAQSKTIEEKEVTESVQTGIKEAANTVNDSNFIDVGIESEQPGNSIDDKELEALKQDFQEHFTKKANNRNLIDENTEKIQQKTLTYDNEEVRPVQVVLEDGTTIDVVPKESNHTAKK